jgi:hypothetical protein
MNDELERSRRGQFKVVSRHFPGESEEDHENPQSG